MRLLLSLLLIANFANAKPSGFRLVHGQAEPPLEVSSGKLEMKSGENTIVEWENFTVASEEHFSFLQQDQNSSILNRVYGGALSEIFGNIQSNGKVFLINPSGILIGKEGRIETNGFLASTSDLSNSNFLSNNIVFSRDETEGKITHLGTIICKTGDVTFFAQNIVNEGEISASTGKVLLETKAKDLIKIESAQNIQESLENSISPYTYAICQKGLIESEEILLFANENSLEMSGSLSAKNIQILGDEITLKQGSIINASSENGGGKILIGGSYQGSDPQIPNAKNLLVEDGVSIYADARSSGNGGQVICWSDKRTDFSGFISAQGGPFGGDGGFAEVSGKSLRFNGIANLEAPVGKTGTLLLDPTNITISTGANSGGSFSGCIGSTNTYTPDASVTDVINTTTLQTNLSTCNVTISTVGSGGGGTGDITVSNTITWTSQRTLRLTSARSVIINAAISNINSSGAVSAYDSLICTGLGVFIQASISTKDGHITCTGTNGSVGDNSNNGIAFGTGTFTLSTTGFGAITLNGTSSGGSSYASGVFLRSSGGTARITVGPGGVDITGVGGTSGGTSSYSSGVWLQGVIISSTTSGNINITGTGGNGGAGNTCSGVSINRGTTITCTNNSMVISGTGGTASGGLNHGIEFIGDGTTANKGTVTTAGSGTVVLTGVAGSDTSYGIDLPTANIINATDTTLANPFVNLIGCCGSAGGSCASSTASGTGPLYGINIGATNAINFNALSSAYLILEGRGGPGSGGSNYGVRFANSCNLSTLFSCTGTGGSGGSNNYGTYLGTNLTTRFAMSFTGSVVLGSSVTLDTTFGGITNGGSVSFTDVTSTIDGTSAGGQNLTITSGQGGIGGPTEFGGSVGANTRLGNITINNGNAVNLGTSGTPFSLTANSFTTPTGIMPITLNSSTTIDTSANNGAISLGYTVNGISNNAQALTLTSGSGAITLSSALGNSVRLGAVTASTTNSSTGFTFGSIIASSFNGSAITKATLGPSAGLNTTSANGNISFGGTIDGNQTFSLNSGTGTITFSGNIGSTTPIGAITIACANAVTGWSFKNITASSLDATNVTQATLSATTTVSTAASNGGIIFGGKIDGAQNLSISSGSGTISFLGAIGSTTPLSALTISTTNTGTGWIFRNITAASLDATNVAQATLGASSTINTSGSNGNISFGGKIDGTQTFLLNAGSGVISFGGNVGSSTALGAITVLTTNSVSGWIFTNITATSINATGVSQITLGASASINTSTAGGNISFGGKIDGNQAFTLNSGVGSITFSEALGSVTPIGAFTVSTTAPSGWNIPHVTAASIDASGVSDALIGTNTNISTAASNGNITFGGTINGANTLTIAAGTGALSVLGNIGGTTPLTSIVTTSVGNLTFSGSYAGASLNLAGVTGTGTIQGAVTTSGSSGVNLNGANFTLGSTMTAGGSGTITWTHTGTLTTSGLITSGGAFSDSGGGTTVLNAGISAPTLNFNTPITLGASPTLTTPGGSITFGSSCTALPASSGVQTINFSLGGGSLTVNGTIGSLAAPLGALSITHTGPLTIGSSGSITSGPFTETGGGTISLSGAIQTPSFDITLNSPISLPGSGIISAGQSNMGNVTINSTLDGPGTVAITGYDVIINGEIGGTIPLGP